MRTTINVDDQLLWRAKTQAAASGVILQLIKDAFRELLSCREMLATQRGRAVHN